MASKLDSKNWANAVRGHRDLKHQQVAQGKIPKRQVPQLSSQDWKTRVRKSQEMRQAGGRGRSLASPGRSKAKMRKTGGMLRSTIPKSRKEITETQRAAMVKTGNQVQKRGINASNWAYNHREATSKRRMKAITQRQTAPKKGINATKWHYDHQKAMKAERERTKNGKPLTHVSAEKRRTQKEASAKRQPQQPQRPRQPAKKASTRSSQPTRKR